MSARSLAAAIVRLIVQLQISDGGYAAHTDVNSKFAMSSPLDGFLTQLFSDSYHPAVLEHH